MLYKDVSALPMANDPASTTGSKSDAAARGSAAGSGGAFRGEGASDGGAAGGADLAALYDAHAARLYATACRLLADPAEAEECVQEVFVRLVERPGSLGRIDEPAAYLFASLRNAAAARGKQGERQRALHLRAAPAAEPHTGEPQQGRAQELSRALETLPLEQRQVLALKVDGELTFAEIAQVLSVSLNTAASRYRYALARLKSALTREDEP